MFPAQTSLIPITVTIAQFIEFNGMVSFLGWYPYWYLGVPARYLAGPVIPITLVLLHGLFSNVLFFTISIYLIFFSFLVAALGWGILANRISGKKKIGIIVALLSLLFPWRYLSSLSFDETSFVISRNFLPFVLIVYWNFLSRRNRKTGTIALIATSFLLLINTTVLAILIVGISTLVLALSFRNGKVKKISKYIKPSLVILAGSLIIVTFWYTPSYWLVTFTNPSIGGAAGYKVILRIFDLLRTSLPFFLAIFAVYFSAKIKSRFSVFGLTWTLTFLFLIIFRFIGDPDFWQDWTSWFFEAEVGIAFLISNPILSLYQRIKDRKKVLLYTNKVYFITVILFLIPFLLTGYIYKLLNRPRLLSPLIPTGVLSLNKLGKIAKESRVFVSGSTVFWANALTDLKQVRGGVDKIATHPYWDHAAYQLREGDDPGLARAWLEALGVSYVLIHSPYSLEAYHDFRNINKWIDVGKIIWEERGDIIIKVPGVSSAWVVDLDKLKNVKSPKGGKDLKSLNRYLRAKKRSVEVVWENPNRVLIKPENLKENEGIILAVSYDSSWRSGNNIKIKKDLLGNILLTISGKITRTIILEYK